ncbi:hypothetical protein D3C76_1439750 [compost metagenome]
MAKHIKFVILKAAVVNWSSSISLGEISLKYTFWLIVASAVLACAGSLDEKHISRVMPLSSGKVMFSGD